MGHRSVSGDAEEAGGCFWAVVTRGPKTAVPPSPGEGRKVSGTHHPVFSRGTTELTQPPWPCCLTAPCLSLPPMCASACLCQAVCRGRAQASIQGPRAQSLPVLHLPLQAWHRLCLLLDSGQVPCSCAVWTSHPVGLLLAPSSFPCSSPGPPGPSGNTHIPPLSSFGMAPFLHGEKREGPSAGDRAQGVPPAAGTPQAPSCALSCLGPSPWLLLQEAAAWAAVPRLEGARVAAGRGCNQECVSRSVAVLPVEGPRADGGGPPQRGLGFCLSVEWVSWGLP